MLVEFSGRLELCALDTEIIKPLPALDGIKHVLLQSSCHVDGRIYPSHTVAASPDVVNDAFELF